MIDAREEAADRFKADQPVERIAAEYGLTVRTVRRWLTEDGLIAKRVTRR